MVETKTLDNLETGKEGYIQSVNCEDKALRRHILDMGLTPGVEVRLIKTAPMGDPLEIRVRGYELTIRKSDASKISIEDIHDAHHCPRKNKEFPKIEHSQKGEAATYVKKKIKPKEKVHFALVGNQNSGKTTLFNKLTGAHQHVGNFPGVTVDRTDGMIQGRENATVTDLPGIYSLSPYSNEEIVTRDFILNEKPDGIINIVDATNIERNLYLTLQLLELNIPTVIALNMMDEVAQSGGSIDINGLEAELGVPVVPISASKGQGIEELIEHAINIARYCEKPERKDFCDEGPLYRCINSIEHLIEDHTKAINLPVRFAATKLAEKDPIMFNSLNLDENEIKTCNHIIKELEGELNLDSEAALADMRFNFTENLCANFVSKPEENIGRKISMTADRILTGKFTAIPTFLIIMGLVFFITFGPVGTILTDIMENIIDVITKITDNALDSYGLNPVVHSLIIDGIFQGVGSVLSFLPVIVTLFFFLSILEDSGYMARVAFFMDKLLRKIGLSGRSFVPMLIGFGCSVPAIMATRTLPSERDRKMTIFLTPFMSCSAKLPIYALFTAAFFEKNQILVIAGLYLIGIIVGIIIAYFMKFFVFRGEAVPFVMELPNYRMPSPINVYRLIYVKSKDFVTKAFTIIFWATIAIWFLQSFDSRLNLVADESKSLLALAGNFITPLFAPLGITDWRVSTAFITGFMAKESVVSTLTILAGDITKLFTPLTAFVFLIFCLLYTPCVAAIATVKRELGRNYALGVILIQCSIAWSAAFLVYKLGLFMLGSCS